MMSTISDVLRLSRPCIDCRCPLIASSACRTAVRSDVGSTRGPNGGIVKTPTRSSGCSRSTKPRAAWTTGIVSPASKLPASIAITNTRPGRPVGGDGIGGQRAGRRRAACRRIPRAAGADEIGGDDASPAAVDRHLELARFEPADGTSGRIDDLNIDRNQVDGRAEGRLLRGDRPARQPATTATPAAAAAWRIERRALPPSRRWDSVPKKNRAATIALPGGRTRGRPSGRTAHVCRRA